MKVWRPLRSVLYVPGNNERAIEKARSLPVDMIIFDLEDAVGDADRESARARVCAVVSRGGFGGRLVGVRINDPFGEIGRKDLHDVLETGVDAVVCPKVKTAQDIISLSSLVDRAVQRTAIDDVQIWAMVETARAILHAGEIAALAENKVRRLGGLIIGTNDLARETGAARSHMAPWLMNCVLAAKAFDLPIIDGVFNQFEDEDGLAKECQRARAMGMNGKSLIHPNQIEICNDSFSPTSEELQEASDIVALFGQPENKTANVVKMKGRMVERLHLDMAHETIGIAEMIANGEGD